MRNGFVKIVLLEYQKVFIQRGRDPYYDIPFRCRLQERLRAEPILDDWALSPSAVFVKFTDIHLQRAQRVLDQQGPSCWEDDDLRNVHLVSKKSVLTRSVVDHR